MTNRNPVTSPQNIWFDSQQVDASNLNLEQTYNQVTTSAIINNHIGTGVIAESLQPRTLFDSDGINGLIDVTYLYPLLQPSDTNYGNQLEVILEGSKACGKRTVKVLIVGLDFNNQIQYETFIFSNNEKQVSKKHFTNILLILANDLRGSLGQSFNLGGRLLINQADPLVLSRDDVMIEQTVQPNLFFRDFPYPQNYTSIVEFISGGLINYTAINPLNIYVEPYQTRSLIAGDNSTIIGQKFLASTNNIQKVTLLLGASGALNNPSWSGTLQVSIHALQTSAQCPTDIVPGTLIEYSPLPSPIAQINVDLNSLQSSGYVLNSVLQPIDFVFSTNSIALGRNITSGSYYVVTIQRSGDASTGEILIGCGQKSTNNSRLTIFNGTVWADITTEDLWFKVHTDAAKVTDGQGYNAGNGVIVPKTTIDSSGNTVDYCLDKLQFTGTDTYTASLFVVNQNNTPVQDQRTGNLVYSRKNNVADVELLNSTQLSKLSETTDLLLLGAISDLNVKKYNTSNYSFTGQIKSATLFKNNIFINPIDNGVDDIEYAIQDGSILGAKVYPLANDPTVYFRVVKAETIKMICGDINGDGVIDTADLELLNIYKNNVNLNKLPPRYSNVSNPLAYVNGYECITNPFVDVASNVSFKAYDSLNNEIASGSNGSINVDDNDPSIAYFNSNTANFVGADRLVITAGTVDQNIGGFDIIEISINAKTVGIKKVIFNENTILEMFRSDIDQNNIIDQNDYTALEDYINKKYFIPPVASTNIGKEFKVYRLVVETYTDRNDDYNTGAPISRDSLVHPIPDVYTTQPAFSSGIDLSSSPITIKFDKQLCWYSSFIVANSRSKLLPVVYEELQNSDAMPLNSNGVIISNYNGVGSVSFDSSNTDVFIPQNLIIGDHGQILDSSGNFYKPDFEVGNLILEIPPDSADGNDKTIDLFKYFVCAVPSTTNEVAKGLTYIGLPAMRFADGSFVEVGAVERNQVRFSASIQSFSPEVNVQNATIVDGRMGVYVNSTTGELRVNFANLYKAVLDNSPLHTKIEINVFLKKSGFNNPTRSISTSVMENLFKI